MQEGSHHVWRSPRRPYLLVGNGSCMERQAMQTGRGCYRALRVAVEPG